jgi:hypothetical protein
MGCCFEEMDNKEFEKRWYEYFYGAISHALKR